jgi:hypothetical protein
MYSGTMIEDLIKAVQKAEMQTRQSTRAAKTAPRMASYPSVYQMYSMTQVQVGMA